MKILFWQEIFFFFFFLFFFMAGFFHNYNIYYFSWLINLHLLHRLKGYEAVEEFPESRNLEF